jgi:hypothetical protein
VTEKHVPDVVHALRTHEHCGVPWLQYLLMIYGNEAALEKLSPWSCLLGFVGSSNEASPDRHRGEQLGDYYLVEANDLDDAIRIAKKVPSVRFGGSVEIRPVVPVNRGK